MWDVFTEDFVGDTLVLSNIDSFDNIMHVSEYWWQFGLLDDDVTVRLGKMLDARDGEESDDWLSVGGKETLASYSPFGDSGRLVDVPESHWQFLESTIPWTASHFFVHANAYPDMPNGNHRCGPPPFGPCRPGFGWGRNVPFADW